MEYSTDLFDAATVDRMLAHYRILLEEIIAHPDQPIGALRMLTEEERTQVLVGWNAAAIDDLRDGARWAGRRRAGLLAVRILSHGARDR